MKVLSKLDTQYYKWPVRDGGTDIPDGALLMPGVTAGTDLGVLIVAATAGADAIGVLQGLRDASETDDTVVAGTAWNTELAVPAVRGTIVRAEYDQTDTMAVASKTALCMATTFSVFSSGNAILIMPSRSPCLTPGSRRE